MQQDLNGNMAAFSGLSSALYAALGDYQALRRAGYERPRYASNSASPYDRKVAELFFARCQMIYAFTGFSERVVTDVLERLYEAWPEGGLTDAKALVMCNEAFNRSMGYTF